ncbi:GntR family transcriptional regulator [Aneurinibacillus sp. Ricciae_BoGa-3]|uniref:GntR family transcriptional regulator n=1 Tax=Aneurinibacillus sp. Ricciae_BoGa-3 TaxID=3022697 RepID=UPI002340A36D|nr:GntR family transcriptional regulator [Aneurinibacillus sp. Ricciae_BoGa-3]WCK54570.1 GntR family transcriptional regulator [Aneurinibacillus sp. Ricciae_BoGa-3]
MDLYLASPKPLKIQAYEILKEAIIRGILKDNEVITERRAMEQFKISRTPFREAIQSLEAEGWMYSIPYKGNYIKPITLEDIEHVFELRIILETSIINKVLTNMDAENISELERLVSSMKKSLLEQDDLVFMDLDTEFHRVIYQLTHNKQIINVFEQTSDLIRRIGVRVLHRETRRDEVITEHKRILAGLKDGTAGEAMIQHLEQTKSIFTELYTKQNEA